MEKITKRTVLEAMISAELVGVDFGKITSEDVKAYATNEIALLDKKSMRAKSSSNEKKLQELAELQSKVLEVVGDTPMSATEIATEIGISTQKANKPIKSLVEDGKLSMTTEKRKNYYTLA